jgi:hypothetical protein
MQTFAVPSKRSISKPGKDQCKIAAFVGIEETFDRFKYGDSFNRDLNPEDCDVAFSAKRHNHYAGSENCLLKI